MYHYYIVSQVAYAARVDEETLDVDTLQTDGTWLAQPDADAFTIMTDGREVSEAEALRFHTK